MIKLLGYNAIIVVSCFVKPISSPLFTFLIHNYKLFIFYSAYTMSHEDESGALLQFKESFVIREFASHNPFSHPKTTSWMPSTHCCSWHGIECDEHIGHVIGIDLSSSQLHGSMDANSSLFSLVHLQRLDLSDNDFNYSQVDK